MSKVNLQIKKNKNYDTFLSRVYCPLSKKTIKIHLGKKTEEFNEVEAMKLLVYLKENMGKYKNYVNEKPNCDYKRLIEEYHRKGEKRQELENNYTLNEVAEKYFLSIEARIKREFIEVYKDRFDIKSEEDIYENQIFKDKIRHSGSAKRSYNKHYKVKEYEYKEVLTTRTKKPRLVKAGVKAYWEIGQKPINEITKQEVQENWLRIQERLDIGQKTKYSIVSLLKTIFNFAKAEGYIKHSVCDDIDKKLMTKNPHNVRQRILNVNEFKELFEELALRKNPNALYGAILAISTGCRAKTALSVRKKDFHLDYENGFVDYYSTIDLINVKLNRFYTLPLPEVVGRYFYYLLKDYSDEEYVIRHNNPAFRTNQPQSEIAVDFRECCDRTVNATPLMKKLYKHIEEDQEKLSNLKINYRYSRLNTTKDMIEAKEEAIKRNLAKIKEMKAKKKADTETYVRENFSFHNLRHMVVSYTSKINPFYASRILDHQKYGVTNNYIKAELEEMRKNLTDGLNKYIIDFLPPKIKELQLKYETNFHKEKENYDRKLRMQNAYDDLEVNRLTSKEDFKNEILYFQVNEMRDLSNYQRDNLLETLKEEEPHLDLDTDEYIMEILESFESDEEKYSKIMDILEG